MFINDILAFIASLSFRFKIGVFCMQVQICFYFTKIYRILFWQFRSSTNSRNKLHQGGRICVVIVVSGRLVSYTEFVHFVSLCMSNSFYVVRILFIHTCQQYLGLNLFLVHYLTRSSTTSLFSTIKLQAYSRSSSYSVGPQIGVFQ